MTMEVRQSMVGGRTSFRYYTYMLYIVCLFVCLIHRVSRCLNISSCMNTIPSLFHINHPPQTLVDVGNNSTYWDQTMGVFSIRAMGSLWFPRPNNFWPLLAIQNPLKTKWCFSNNQTKKGALKTGKTNDAPVFDPRVPKHGLPSSNLT